MKVYAHRGFSRRYLENTMEAFIAADLVGAAGIELDVRLSADREVMVHHDLKLARVFQWQGTVFQKHSHILKKISVNKKGRTYHIPTLDDFLFWFSTRNLMVNIEFKTEKRHNNQLEQQTIALLEQYQVKDRVFFSSFDASSLQRAQKIAPEIPAGLLVKRAEQASIKKAAQLGLAYYHPSYKNLTKELVDQVHAEELMINVWTVNAKDKILQLKNLGVDGIITDDPQQALDVLNNPQERGNQ